MSPPKTGKRPAVHDPRTLKLFKYFSVTLPEPPAAIDWASRVMQPWTLGSNDVVSDCVEVMELNLIHLWTAATGQELVLPDFVALSVYADLTGYKPSDGLTDRGTVMLDALKAWRTKGVSGHTIAAFALCSFQHVRHAINLFGGLAVGLNLPVAWQSESEVWDVPTQGDTSVPGSWGGHAVAATGYDAEGVNIVTWAERRKVTWRALAMYCDEAYALISRDFFTGDKSMSGFDAATMGRDLDAVR